MVRTQIQLTQEQSLRLRRSAVQEGVSLAEMIRRSVDAYLVQLDRREGRPSIEATMSRVGAFRSGRSDVARRHDDYLAEAYLGRDGE